MKRLAALPAAYKAAGMAKEPCPACDDTYWVCENHPDKPWRKPSPGVEGCECGAGMPCELCNAGSGPALMPDFTVTIDDKGPRH